jgi:segregation and condensation protein B
VRVENEIDVKSQLEVILFLAADPVAPADLKETTGLAEEEIRQALEDLALEYEARAGGLRIGRIGGGYQIYADPTKTEWARKFRRTARAQKLSMAALETLALIAYRQPLTKAEIEDIRGVSADGVLKNLLERRLIRIVGKKEAPGRPILYGTTKEFLQYFGLGDLSEMPTLKDLEREDAA